MMKRTLSRSHSSKLSGFTLVELLVVIGIIAILASVILFAGTSALRAAKQAKAQTTASAIQAAALGYYTEYSVYPVPAGTPAGQDYSIADLTGNQGAWGVLIEALSGNTSPYNGLAKTGLAVPNARAITFLSLKASDVDNGDAPLNPVPTGTEIYFNIAMDSDYDGMLGGTSTSTGLLPNFATATVGTTDPVKTGSSSAGVVVWANCNGKTTVHNPSFWVHTY